MGVETDTSTIDSESTLGAKPFRTKKASGSPYKKRPGSAPGRKPSFKDDSEKKREQWLKALRTGNGKTLSGRPITGTTGTSTARSAPPSATGAPRSIKVTMKTDSSDKAFLSSSKFLQQKLLANSIMAATGGDYTSTPRTGRGDQASARSLAPSSRQPEDMVDEIMELKRKLTGMENLMSTQKGRLRRLEEDNNRKDKQIEQLLNPGASDDARRGLGDKKGESSASVVNSLKNKVMKLEITLKDKENELRKVQDDVKTTRSEEMKICMEAFYQEITRLRAAVHTGKKTSLGTDSSRIEKEEDSASNKKVKTLNANILRLSELNKQLEAENAGLKQDLDTALEAQKTPTGVQFEDMDRAQLLATMADYQQKLDKYERVMAAQVEDDEAPAVEGKLKLEGSFADRYAALDKQETELLKELEKVKASLAKSREERDNWRSQYETLKSEKPQSYHSAPPHSSTAQSVSGGYSSGGGVALDEPDNAAEDSLANQRRREDEQWRQKGKETASRKPGSVADKEVEVRKERESKTHQAAVQLQSLLRAHMTRSGNKGGPTSRVSVAGSVISTGGGGATRVTGGRGGRLTPDEDGGDSTARTHTERSQRTNLEPISDKSETSSVSGLDAFPSLSSPARAPVQDSKKKQGKKPATAGNVMDFYGGGGPVAKPRKPPLESEDDSTLAEDTTGGGSDTDTTATPRTPKPRKTAPTVDYGF